MTREGLLALLRCYADAHPAERSTTARITSLLERRPDCFERTCFDPGHITASAWIVSRESRAVLLTHHRKLDRWLQLGGHADGDPDVLACALREAREESGIETFDVLPSASPPVILDVDVHGIPARGAEPAHEHHDIRFLLETSERAPIARQASESMAMRWFEPAEVAHHLQDESLARMARKAAVWLGRIPPGNPDRSSGRP